MFECLKPTTAGPHQVESAARSLQPSNGVTTEQLTETHEALVSAADRKLRRLCGKAYWKTHHDGVINNYREASVSAWGTLAGPGTDEEALPRSIVERIKRQVETETGGDPIDWLDPHILDLAAGGDIRAHVDNLQASGSIITGLCLMSPAVAVFRSAKDPNVRFSAWLEPRTLYVQRDDLRFVYTHEILATLPWRGSTPKEVRGRRMSLMMRNAK
ncbi:Alpha-ketoglutarate-dependent dioxygenase alkB 7, mitochondrial [Thoreauomyces humboldtii]|nr:Alpha-ketoglutarate-dependent dioxygenase alkB 7, mitochondrial [Thoreauomyces humboldtii]